MTSQGPSSPTIGGRPLGQLGLSYSGAVGTAALQTIMAPGSNVNGVIIRAAYVNTGSNAGALFVDTAAPASQADYTKRRLISGLNTNVDYRPMLRDVFVPAGNGIYFWGNGAGSEYLVSYDLL